LGRDDIVVLEDLLSNFSFDSPGIVRLLIASAVAFGFGYWVYVYCIIFLAREKKSPYPNWMHTFYFSCDVTGTVFWFLMAKNNDWFWFFVACSAAMFVWVLCEIWSLYMAVKHERQAIWGKYYDGPVTVRQALSRIVGEIAWFMVVVNLTNHFFGGLDDAAMFKWYVWTNLLVAVGPSYYWAKQRNGDGKSVGLAVMILVSIVATYLPPGFGMWTTASSYFHTPWFYLAGLVATGYAIYNLRLVTRYPQKTAAPSRVAGSRAVG